MEKIINSKILEKLQIKKSNYFVVSSHREENIDSNNTEVLISCLNLITEKYDLL